MSAQNLLVVLQNSLSVLQNSPIALQNSVIVFQNSLIVLQNSQIGLQNSLIALPNSLIALQNSPSALQNSQIVLQNSLIVLQNSLIVLHNSPIALQNSLIVLHNSPIVLQNSQIVLQNSRIVLQNSPTGVPFQPANQPDPLASGSCFRKTVFRIFPTPTLKAYPPLRSEHDFLEIASWVDRARALELLIEHDGESNNRDFQPSCLHTRSAFTPADFFLAQIALGAPSSSGQDGASPYLTVQCSDRSGGTLLGAR